MIVTAIPRNGANDSSGSNFRSRRVNGKWDNGDNVCSSSIGDTPCMDGNDAFRENLRRLIVRQVSRTAQCDVDRPGDYLPSSAA